MPLPLDFRPDPERPFTTVRTAIDAPEPQELRNYASREDCLTDLQRWRDASVIMDAPYYHLGIGEGGDERAYIFEVHEEDELRLAVSIDRQTIHENGPWARPDPFRNELVQNPGQAFPFLPSQAPALKLDDWLAQRAGDQPHDAVSWALAQDKSTAAGRLLADLSDPDKIDPTAARAIIRTFEANCERAEANADPAGTPAFERILRRSIEQHRKTMDDTPERTWDRIKADYAAVFEAAGGNVNQVPYQDGYPALHDLARQAKAAAHYPDRQEDKLSALLDTLDTCAERKIAINDLHVDMARARAGLDRLIRNAGTHIDPRIERDPDFPEWSNFRATAITRWTHAVADPDLSQHLPHWDYDAMKTHFERLADPAIPTVFHPRALAVSREPILNSPMRRLASAYEHALKSVRDDPNLLPYSLRLDSLQLTLQWAREKCSGVPEKLAHIESLAAQLEVAHQRRTSAQKAAESLNDASGQLVQHINWSKSNRKPVHEAPGFGSWRENADRVAARCQAILKDPHLAPHFTRAGASADSARTAILFLRDDQYRMPPSPEAIAAQRQARAEARADAREEPRSMSA
ncbi:MAG: hypothetical protein F4Y01_06100 [Gammaproteobacteria bacterium]|nr:hypothetical protein [Gammaproteobacteria bacterium]